MKILLTHKFFKYIGGAEVFFFEVGRVLEENGHEVAYFSTSDKDNIPTKYSEYFINSPKFKEGNVFQKTKAFMKIPYNFEAKKKFSKLIDDFKPDLIHIFNVATQISPSILDVAHKKCIPIVFSCNDYKHICPNYKLYHHGKICEECNGGKFYNCIKNKCAHDSLLFSTASTIESYIHNYLNIYKKNIDLFLFASDFMAHKTEEFWGGSFKWGKLMNPFKISGEPILDNKGEYGLYFGRLIDEKGVDILIESLKLNKDIPFKIVGDGPDLDKLKQLAQDNNLNNIEFTGAVWGKQLDLILRDCKFVVVPSIWHENFPYVILQAFAAGKPVIGSNRGGIPELVVDNERGAIYDANNPVELSEKLKLFYDDDELCLKFGKNARQFVVDNFNDTVFYEQLMINYTKVL